MNVYVMVDAEGLSGVFLDEQTGHMKPRYSEARRAMTDDINALVEGLKAAGAERIAVRDCHSNARTVIYEELSDLADEYIVGPGGGVRMPGIEAYDAVILLGYHAMAGTPEAVLEHSWSYQVQSWYMNGERIGEIGMDTLVAGDYAKPVILVTGDDKACAEAEAFIPGVQTVQVKQGLSVHGAILPPPKKARRMICEGAIRAVQNASNVKPIKAEPPVTLRVEVAERSQMPDPATRPYIRIVDWHTYDVTGNSAEDVLLKF